MSERETYLAVGIWLWMVLLAVSVPPEWAMKLYRTPIGRFWDGLVMVIERSWSAFIQRVRR